MTTVILPEKLDDTLTHAQIARIKPIYSHYAKLLVDPKHRVVGEIFWLFCFRVAQQHLPLHLRKCS